MHETSVRVLFSRFYLVSHPQGLEDDPRPKWGPEEGSAVSAGDGIGLNSVTSEHTAHVTLVVFGSATDVPADVRSGEPRYWFTSTTRQIALTDAEGSTALVVPAPASGRIACAVECRGRDETSAARHHDHRDDIHGLERRRTTVWPDAAPSAGSVRRRPGRGTPAGERGRATGGRRAPPRTAGRRST
ncbi:hypothetical protein CKY47_14845 [Saccharothrix yanglingensis]|uniref:Uncharacterized protein n=1 Tax=Saccharothrix yanglingensis TaxID=659496 RepID=A0ABU0WZD3_9PSEU|nr:hypothetical protein [Saccharothrix yanglingensis]